MKLNEAQKVVLVFAIFAIAGIGVFVPWVTTSGEPVGYGVIFDPPYPAGRVDLPRVLLPLAVVVLVAGGIMWLFGLVTKNRLDDGWEIAARD